MTLRGLPTGPDPTAQIQSSPQLLDRGARRREKFSEGAQVIQGLAAGTLKIDAGDGDAPIHQIPRRSIGPAGDPPQAPNVVFNQDPTATKHKTTHDVLLRSSSDATSSAASSPPASVSSTPTHSPQESPQVSPQVPRAERSSQTPSTPTLSRLKSLGMSMRSLRGSSGVQTQTPTQTMGSAGSVKDTIRCDENGKITIVHRGVSWKNATPAEWNDMCTAIRKTVEQCSSRDDEAVLCNVLSVAAHSSRKQLLDVLTILAEAQVPPQHAPRIQKLLFLGKESVLHKETPLFKEHVAASFEVATSQSMQAESRLKVVDTESIAKRYTTVSENKRLPPQQPSEGFPLGIDPNGTILLPKPPPTSDKLQECLKNIQADQYACFLKNVEITLGKNPLDPELLKTLANGTSNLEENRLIAFQAVVAQRLNSKTPSLPDSNNTLMKGIVTLIEKRIENAWKKRVEELVEKTEKVLTPLEFAETVDALMQPSFTSEKGFPGITYPFTENQALQVLAENFSKRNINNPMVRDFVVFMQERQLFEIAGKTDATFALLAMQLDAQNVQLSNKVAIDCLKIIDDKVNKLLSELGTVDQDNLKELERIINGIICQLKICEIENPQKLLIIKENLEKIEIKETEVLLMIIEKSIFNIQQEEKKHPTGADNALEAGMENWALSLKNIPPATTNVNNQSQETRKQAELSLLAPNGKITATSLKAFAEARKQYLLAEGLQQDFSIYDVGIERLSSQLMSNIEIDITTREGIILMNELVDIVTTLEAVRTDLNPTIKNSTISILGNQEKSTWNEKKLLNLDDLYKDKFERKAEIQANITSLCKKIQEGGKLTPDECAVLTDILKYKRASVEKKADQDNLATHGEKLLWKERVPETPEEQTKREILEFQHELGRILYGSGQITQLSLSEFFTRYEKNFSNNPEAQKLIATTQAIIRGYFATSLRINTSTDEGRTTVYALAKLTGALFWACQQDKQVIANVTAQLNTLQANVEDPDFLERSSDIATSTRLSTVLRQVSEVSKNKEIILSKYSTKKLSECLKNHPFTMMHLATLSVQYDSFMSRDKTR